MAYEGGREVQDALEAIDEFLDILACPACGGSIRREGQRLHCETCLRQYPIVDGIPVMLVEPQGEEPA